MANMPETECEPCNTPILLQLGGITSILTFISLILSSATFYILHLQKRKLQLRKIHVESNAHIAGIQEIIWAISAVKEEIKAGNDSSSEAKEVLESVSRLLQTSERELDQLTKRSGDVESMISGKRGWRRWRKGCF